LKAKSQSIESNKTVHSLIKQHRALLRQAPHTRLSTTKCFIFWNFSEPEYSILHTTTQYRTRRRFYLIRLNNPFDPTCQISAPISASNNAYHLCPKVKNTKSP